MKIELLDEFFEKTIYEHRVCKLRYSYAFESYLRNKICLLRKRYNVYTIDELFSETFHTSTTKNGFTKWFIGLIKNLLGLTPQFGAVFTVVFSISDTISFFKMSDLQKLAERLRVKEKPHKKYKKLKNIIAIKNCSHLNAEEIKKVQVIKELIEQKYIVNTTLIICEPLDFQSKLNFEKSAVTTISLDNDLLKHIYGFNVKPNCLKLINVLGIEYAEYIKNLDDSTTTNNEALIKKFTKDMLQKEGYDKNDELLDFLKLCSLLFDVFSYDDAKTVSCIKDLSCESELQKSVNAKIIDNFVPNEYRFFMNFLRDYYQKQAQFYDYEIKHQIWEYLKKKYPNKHIDLALASILTSNNEAERISLCLKALYYDKNSIEIYKKNKIKEYMSSRSYVTIANLTKLNDIYEYSDYSNSDATQLCLQSFLGLPELQFLSIEDKLICLSVIGKVSYEIMPLVFLEKIDGLYRKLLQDIRISKTYKKYTLFILDYLVFSTCMEDKYETTQVVQRLVSYLKKISMPLDIEIKFLRLGNAIFYNDYNEGLKLTKQAYLLSEGYPIERKYSAINYSCSLGMCGKYAEAHTVLQNEFHDMFYKKNTVSMSATNNYLIATYLHNLQDGKWLIEKISSLKKVVLEPQFSDQQIINNNLLAAYIENDALEFFTEIRALYKEITLEEDDVYHLFFAHHNMMIYYFLIDDSDAFERERNLCVASGLLAPYNDFFEAKGLFLKENLGQKWDIKLLQTELAEWSERYSEEKYTMYKHPVLFGFIERWFE